MAKARLLAPWVDEERRSAIYHCVSRVVDRRFIFGDAEREQFVTYLRMYEAFCGLRVLSYCVMSNHFHILVEVPPRMDESLSDEGLIERLKLIYSDDYVGMVEKQLRALAESTTEKGKAAHVELREQFTKRMWDLGLFMKTLKQRFTRWYNAQNGRCGTLWEARYKSVLVENGHAARVMSAYIDLNPVRAGMVKSPENYRWCSYAEAVAGGKRGSLARRGIARVLEERENQGESDSAYDGWEGDVTPEHYAWRGIAGRYRLILFEDGEEIINASGKQVRRGFRSEDVEREQERGGKMRLSEVLRIKTHYFVDGGVIGGREFVKDVVESLRGGYLSAERKSNGSKMPDHDGELWSMRQLE
jgi:REP element-mobilizing transposase RayT